MSNFDDLPILAEGEWLYDGTVPVRLRVFASPMYYGTGDYEDPSDIAEDRPGNFYIIASDGAGTPGEGGMMIQNLGSIEEVLAAVEKNFPSARWLKPLEGA
jgi:hypothetical protein